MLDADGLILGLLVNQRKAEVGLLVTFSVDFMVETSSLCVFDDFVVVNQRKEVDAFIPFLEVEVFDGTLVVGA